MFWSLILLVYGVTLSGMEKVMLISFPYTLYTVDKKYVFLIVFSWDDIYVSLSTIVRLFFKMLICDSSFNTYQMYQILFDFYEGYSRNVSFTLSLIYISMFLLHSNWYHYDYVCFIIILEVNWVSKCRSELMPLFNFIILRVIAG